jgi:hypothetical protein
LQRCIGSHSLGEFPLDVVRIECPRCGRAGSYRLDGLMARFGPDAAVSTLPRPMFSAVAMSVTEHPALKSFTASSALSRADGLLPR